MENVSSFEIASFMMGAFGLMLTLFLEWPRIAQRINNNSLSDNGSQPMPAQPDSAPARLQANPKPVFRSRLPQQTLPAGLTRSNTTSPGKSLFAVVVCGLIFPWIIGTIGVFTVSETFGGNLIILTGIIGMIWAYSKLRRKSWRYLLQFFGVGLMVYFVCIYTLDAFGLIIY